MARDVSLQVLPLGGVGRIGMNAMLVGAGDDWLLLDCGVSFAEPEQTGIELVLPNLKVLGSFNGRIKAIVLTHGHEDHIGALPYVLKVVKAPVYATRFTWGLIDHKLREHGLADQTNLHVISPSSRVQAGCFDLRFLRVTHSIPDCVSLAIRSPYGNVLFTGDFKIEAGLRDGCEFDEAGFRAFGDEGVDLMMADSTNAEVAGWSASEASVGARLDALFGEIKGRILVGLFASNVYRVHAVVDAARRNGRYCALLGRSLQRYCAVANQYSAMPFDPDDFVEVGALDRYDDDELVVLCTGSQAEPRAALARVADGTHPEVTVKPGDTVVMSARQIPGNERRIHAMFNEFARRGAHVVHTRVDRAIHASGHACQDELRQLIAWVRPKLFIPVHGEYTFLQRHAEIATEQGVAATLLIENGQTAHIKAGQARVVGQRDVEPWYADGLACGDAETLQIKARQNLGHNGAIAVELTLSRVGKLVAGSARVQPFGIQSDQGELAAEIAGELQRWATGLDARAPVAAVESALQAQVRKIAKRYTQRKPVVLAFARWRDGDDD